jgi:hypothetical protein
MLIVFLLQNRLKQGLFLIMKLMALPLEDGRLFSVEKCSASLQPHDLPLNPHILSFAQPKELLIGRKVTVCFHLQHLYPPSLQHQLLF